MRLCECFLGVAATAGIELGRKKEDRRGALDNRPRRFRPQHSNRRAGFFLVPDAVFQSGLKHGPTGENVHTFHLVPTPPKFLERQREP